MSRVLTLSISPVTVLSAAFRSRLPLGRSRNFALTINGGPHGAFTTYTGVSHRPRTAPDGSTKPFACCRGYLQLHRPPLFPRGQCVLIELSLIFTSLSLFPIFRCHVTLWDRHHILP
ncbi:hypothetical protein C8J57DRAFT_1276269 [Mycena rebaudengoi]|nr:hypothetical protein C8J57DRAFT_1276269 [Mycena rebaudengoi]